VQSVQDQISTELQRSVTRAVDAGTQLLTLSDYAEVDLPRVVREEQPDVVLTIGEAAFKTARKVRGVPVVAILSLSLGANRSVPANVTGIDVRIDPSRYMALFNSLGLKRVGVTYDPARSGVYLAKAQHAAALAGIELVLRPVREPREAVKSLESLKGSAADGLWLVPDPTVVTPLTLEANFTYSLEQKKPVVSYTEAHLRKGAAVTLNPELGRMGLQAGEMVRRLLDGVPPREIPLQSPQGFSLNSNEVVMKYLRIAPARVVKFFPWSRE
jgi:putative tryptophan/tyrosine transport system substrate-binding protein